jgi:hypothetical protein
MKKYFVVPLLAVFFAACSNPLLEWIETPASTETQSQPQPQPQPLSGSSKAIVEFAFGISGEEISIKAARGQDGSIPIKAVLPAGSTLVGLRPSIRHDGASITPSGGTAQTANPYTDSPRDFTGSRDYTVTAADGSTQAYTVQVYVKNAQPAAIVWCDLEIPGSGSPPVMAEGVVTEGTGVQPGSIVLRVPPGTPLTGLTAKIAQTGTLVEPNNTSHPETAITLTGDFSSPVTYKVKASDGSEKKYTVTVVKEKSPIKEITALSFYDSLNNEVPGSVLIGGEPSDNGKYPIVATVPPGTDLSATDLTPLIAFEGASITPPGGSAQSAHPFTGSPRKFNAPLTYRVTAEDSTYRDYTVTVLASDNNSAKQITGFYIFPNTQGAEGVSGIINETAKTIAVTVPPETALSSLSPTVYHTGASVNPISGAPKDFSNSVAVPVPYTVTARNGSSQTYMVSVFTAKRGDKAITFFEFDIVTGETADIGLTPGVDGTFPIVVTVPAGTNVNSLKPIITHTGYSLASRTGSEVSASGGPGTVAGSASASFASPRIYRVTAEDGSYRDYAASVIQASGPGETHVARIDAFYFTNPVAIGTIDQNAHSIAVTVPWDTNLSTLIPTIHFTGLGIEQGNLPPYSGPQMPSPATTLVADFSSSGLPYTVTALNGYATVTYAVTVTRLAKPASAAREITAFTFDGIPVAQTTTVIAGTPVEGLYPIEVTVPSLTDLTALKPVITYTGKSIGGQQVSRTGSGPETTTANAPVDFTTTSPVSYLVTAENGLTRDYVVTVRAEDNDIKEITGFYFASPMAVGVIDQASHSITVKVPYGTNLYGLVPTVFYNGLSLDPVSGMANNFGSQATYTVKARNGTAQPYTVRVLPGQNNAKEITAFTFPGVGVLETVIGAVPDADGNIPVSVTVDQNTTSIGSLSPDISHTGKTISPGSGVSRDFRTPVLYMVTAEDGSTKDYAVSVHVSSNSSALITGFVFRSVPIPGGSIQAVGSIDQDRRAITVALPRTTAVLGSLPTSLTPTITYIGASIKLSGAGSEETDNPFTDTARDFTGTPVKYTVTAADSSEQEYTVTVKFEEQNLGLNVTFQGISDPVLITASFDQSTGRLTLTINPNAPSSKNPTGYRSPYTWELDGTPVDAPTAATTLVLHTGSLGTGQHQLVLFAFGGTDGLPYTNTVLFTVNE